jgi:hypothetical protein
MRDGQKVLREYSPNGLKNSIHLLMKFPEALMLDFLLKLKIDHDSVDYDE